MVCVGLLLLVGCQGDPPTEPAAKPKFDDAVEDLATGSQPVQRFEGIGFGALFRKIAVPTWQLDSTDQATAEFASLCCPGCRW